MKNIYFRKCISNPTCVFQFVAILSGLLILFSNQALAQESSNDVLTIDRPDSIDDATWQRLLTDFENEKQGFVELLRLLDVNRIDYTKGWARRKDQDVRSGAGSSEVWRLYSPR